MGFRDYQQLSRFALQIALQRELLFSPWRRVVMFDEIRYVSPVHSHCSGFNLRPDYISNSLSESMPLSIRLDVLLAINPG